MQKIIRFNSKKLNQLFNISSSGELIYELYEGISGCEGELNPFYGKKHTKETKEKLREITLELCKDESFRLSRSNYGEKKWYVW